jgi:hypothetical protein
MLDTYVRNRGATKTIIHNNHHNNVSEINWDADYDGNFANISLDLNQNGKTNHYDVKLDNGDLAEILNVPSVNLPIHKRLSDDFIYIDQPKELHLDLERKRSRKHRQRPSLVAFENISQPLLPDQIQSSQRSIKNPGFYTHISSPLQNEEILVPLSFDKKTLNRYTMTPNKHHKKLRTHRTHRFYKQPLSSKRTKSNRNLSRTYRK